jgi:hypothetical protein
MAIVGGISRVTVDGVELPIKQGWTFNVGRPLRTSVMGADGRHGSAEEPQTGYAEGGITLTEGIDLEWLVTVAGATVNLEYRSGRVGRLVNADYAGTGELAADEGELSVRFEGEGSIDG